MSEKFENQKEQLVSLKQEISLLHQQINYLLRNEKALELLDLDVLMNRTHTIYDLLCSINIGDSAEEEDYPIDAEALSGMFGVLMQETPDTEQEEAPEATEDEKPQAAEPARDLGEKQPETPEIHTSLVMNNDTNVPESELEKPTDSETSTTEESALGDEFGFFFRFEDIPENEEEKKEEAQEPVEQDGKLVHMVKEVPEEQIPERDRVAGEDLVQDNPLEMPKMEDERTVGEELVEERQTSGTVSDFFEKDDTGFELSTPETLGDRMMGEDHSLAARLQQNPVRDLKSAIGINDKFLFVNELFGGSMEKYNKSIENLNDLKTMNGAMIYLNELKIELQWNSSNEAYQKLADLVRRKFE